MIYESMKEVSLFIFISKMKMKFTKLDNFKSLLKVQEKKKKKKKIIYINGIPDKIIVKVKHNKFSKYF